MNRKKLSQTFRICMALMLSVFTSGILQAAPAFATHQPNHDPKVFVCKYVGTPGVNETLQTGTNPISVSSSSTGGTAVGSSFADAQGRSYVLAIDDTAPGPEGDPDVSACPAAQGPTVIALPAAPSVSDPCGVGNATWDLPADTATLDWSLTAGVLSVSIIPANTTFPGGTVTHNFGLAVETNVAACVTVITLPAAPSITDPCGAGNATWDLPADTATLNWDLTAGVLTVSIIPANTTFPGGATMHNFGTAVETNTAACVTVIALPAAPSVSDPCGVGNATWDLPADTATLDWSLSAGGELSVAIIPANTTFPGGAVTHNFGLAVETNVDECEEDRKIDICHATSAVINPYNKINVSISAADGGGDNGDHFNEHDGPIFNPATDVNGGDWGDIIPPIAGSHTGLNWTTQGQAIYNNGDCVYVPPTDFCPLVPGVQDDTTLCPPGQGGGGQVLGTTTTTPPTQPPAAPLPATLPATGDNDGPLALILAMITAYGATYFLQGRRQFSTSPHHAASHK